MCNCRRSECSYPHKGGGVLMYSRSSFNCECFDSAQNCESLWIKLSQPTDPSRLVFINVTYHPPNTNGAALINYLSSSLNKIITDFPTSTIIIGGDFNRLDLQDIETRFCLSILDTPPTRGDICLDVKMEKILVPPAVPCEQPRSMSANGRAWPSQMRR